MLLPEMGVRALPPATNEIVIQSRPNERAGDWNQPSRPLFHEFGAGLGRNALNDSWHQAIDHVLLQKLAPQVHAGSAGGSDPKLRDFLLGVVFEAIYQAQLLDR